MDLLGNPMGASVSSSSNEQGGSAALPPRIQQRLRLRRASSAAKLPPNSGSEGAKVEKKAKALKRRGTRSDGAADDAANGVANDVAKVVGKARVLKRHRTPDLTNLCLKRAWFAATSLDGLSGVFIPTVKKQGYEYALITPTSTKWFMKMCFGVVYYKTINGNAIREVLLRIWRDVEQQIGQAPKDF